MGSQKFKAVLLDQKNNVKMEKIDFDQLSYGDVIVKNYYSTLNYKDMLAFQKENKIIKNYPMIPGIDLSGIIIKSETNEFHIGDKVIATGYDIGISHTGGLAEYSRLSHEWLVPLPNKFSLKEAMIIGTAGLAAGLSINELENNGMKVTNQPQIIVSGATGGVGSLAILILKKIGYQNITAIIRKDYQYDIARKLGATNVIYGSSLENKKLLQKQQYDFAIDAVGGKITQDLLPKISYGGSIALCGNAGGNLINTNVFPFILRKVNLLGIDTVNMSKDLRINIWNKFANEWNITQDVLFNEVNLDNIVSEISKLKSGNHLGRSVVRLF